jgi:hypothetical protein
MRIRGWLLQVLAVLQTVTAGVVEVIRLKE